MFVLPNFAWGQITLLLTVQLLFCAYICETQPFEDKVLNKLEILNECMLLFAIYWLYIFAGLISDPELAYIASEWLTYALYTLLTLNFFFAIVMTVYQIIRDRYLKKRLEDKKKEKQLRQQTFKLQPREMREILQ